MAFTHLHIKKHNGWWVLYDDCFQMPFSGYRSVSVPHIRSNGQHVTRKGWGFRKFENALGEAVWLTRNVRFSENRAA